MTCSRPQSEAGLGLHLYQHSPSRTGSLSSACGDPTFMVAGNVRELGAGGASGSGAQVDVGRSGQAGSVPEGNFWGIVFTGLSEWTLLSSQESRSDRIKSVWRRVALALLWLSSLGRGHRHIFCSVNSMGASETQAQPLGELTISGVDMSEGGIRCGRGLNGGEGRRDWLLGWGWVPQIMASWSGWRAGGHGGTGSSESCHLWAQSEERADHLPPGDCSAAGLPSPPAAPALLGAKRSFRYHLT